MEYLKAFQPKTISHYEHLKKILIDYSKYSFRTYYPEDMSNGFYEDFTRYMRVQRDFVDTTTGTVIKVLKSFLNKIVKEGINVNPDYRDFKVIRVTIPQTIALTEEEIEEIDKLELNDKKMEFGRDLMFVQLHTAQRRSDLFQIRKEHIDLNQKKIKLTQIKTGNQVVLPLTDKMLEMLEKYSYQLPQMSKSDYNIALKKLCKAAGLMELTEIIRMQGNVRKAIVKPRYAFVSSHTIRRTAITILLRRGVMPEYVRKVAGIKSYEVFQKYIKLSQDEAVDSVRDFWNK
jgi:integrase